MRASDDRWTPLKTTTASPTIDVTPATCFALMLNRMESGRAVLLFDLQPVQLVVQRFQADAEQLGRASLVVVRVLERQENQLTLGLLDCRAWLESDARLAAVPGLDER